MRSKNPLDVLFHSIEVDLKIEEEAKASRRQSSIVASQRASSQRLSTYANPNNWRLGKVVCLIHITEGSLGVFQEYFHRLSPSARRLLPAAKGLAVDRNELVFGEYWLHPHFSAPEVNDSAAEVRAITARFNELMELEEQF